MAPEHKRLHRYDTMTFAEIAALPVGALAQEKSHLYLWCPNALLSEALKIMQSWGFTYKTNLVWLKIRKDGGPDGRGVGFYFRNVTELLRKPAEVYTLIEACSPSPYLELFAREQIASPNWRQWGHEVETYMHNPKVFPGYNGNGRARRGGQLTRL
jgi:N6-adenosine-specific RNA methylase IME4